VFQYELCEFRTRHLVKRYANINTLPGPLPRAHQDEANRQ
jgi:hypothetical protein